MTQLLPEFFRRQDERPDQEFYGQPRLVGHIDETASDRAKALYHRLLPEGGRVLDLMASVTSHLPDKFDQVVGLGLNRTELEHNPLVTRYLLYDLNINPTLPFETASLDGVVCTVSVQYMTRPVEVFREVARCLKPHAPFVVSFSNRMFPTKAVLAWLATDDAAHIRLVRSYFDLTGRYTLIQEERHTPMQGDPLYALWAYPRVSAARLNGIIG